MAKILNCQPLQFTMKYTLTLILTWLLCLAIESEAQKGPNADSVINMIMNKSVSVEEQIEQFHQYVRSTIKVYPKVAEKVSLHMLKIAEYQDYMLGKAHAHYNLGWGCVYGPYPKALEELSKAYEYYEQLNNLEGLANTQLSLALVYQGMIDRDKAVNEAKRAEKTAVALGDKKILSRVHTNLCSIYHYFDQTDSSLYHGKIALQLKREINDEYGIRLMLLNMGVIMANHDSLLEQGLQYLKEARQISSDPIMINDITANMIYAYSRMNKVKMAEVYLDSALAGSDTIDNDYTLQGIHRIAREMYANNANYAKAYDHIETEFELDRQIRGEEVKKEYEVLLLENENAVKEKQIALLEKEKAETYFRYVLFIMISVFVAAMGVLIFLVMRYRVRNSRLKQAELKRELEHKNKELTSFALNFVQKNELIESIKQQIDQIQKKALPETLKEINQINRIIDQSFRVDNEWENFKVRFEDVHENFFTEINARYPDLGNAEVKLCALLRLNMNLKESSQILGISPDSVKTARYRIRKKLGLTSEDNLVSFMATIGN